MKASETLVLKSELVFDEAAHRYYLDGTPVPNVTRVLEAAGLTNYHFLGALREEHLARGRAVHEATHRDDNHDLAEESVSAEILGFVEAWRRFRRDFGFVPRLVEHKVYNPQFKYAGRIDRVGSVRDGGEFIVDIKTGVAPAAVAIQLSAYSACLPRPRTRLRRCVELHADATYKVIPYQMSDYQRDFNEFLAALETYKAKEEEKCRR
jgi:RecB family exonuclease